MAAATTTDGGTTKRCAAVLIEELTSMQHGQQHRFARPSDNLTMVCRRAMVYALSLANGKVAAGWPVDVQAGQSAYALSAVMPYCTGCKGSCYAACG